MIKASYSKLINYFYKTKHLHHHLNILLFWDGKTLDKRIKKRYGIRYEDKIIFNSDIQDIINSYVFYLINEKQDKLNYKKVCSIIDIPIIKLAVFETIIRDHYFPFTL